MSHNFNDTCGIRLTTYILNCFEFYSIVQCILSDLCIQDKNRNKICILFVYLIDLVEIYFLNFFRLESGHIKTES